MRVIDSPFGRIGLSVCYDLRFPELYRAMKDVDIIVVPSAFTETTGRAHWETLIRARAIENLAYVLAPAQGGYHLSGRETHGNSMIVDPWGVVLDRLPRGSGVVIAGVNPSYQANLRKSLPALEASDDTPGLETAEDVETEAGNWGSIAQSYEPRTTTHEPRIP